MPPGDGGQRQARAEEDNGNHEEEPRSDRCGALQSVSCRAANPQDPSPAPQDRTASENEERQADRLRSARRELRILRLPILRLPPYRPLFQEKTFIGLPCSTSRRRKSGGDTDEKGSRLPRPIVREVSFRTPSIPRKRASQEHQPLFVVENPCVPHKSSVQFARGPRIRTAQPDRLPSGAPTVFGRARRTILWVDPGPPLTGRPLFTKRGGLLIQKRHLFGEGAEKHILQSWTVHLSRCLLLHARRPLSCRCLINVTVPTGEG